MPIQGLTTTIVTMPPVIGSLRKGGEKETRTKGDRTFETFGKDLNHFRFTAKNESDSRLLQAFATAYGATPERINNIYLPGPEVDDNLMAFCEEYSAAKLIHRCDSVWIYERDNHTGQLYRTSHYCPYADENPDRVERPKDRMGNPLGCKQVGRLHVILPELVDAGYYGVVTVLTHSINDIAKLYQALTNYRECFGPLNRYPFAIYRANETISTPNGDKRARREKSLLNIVPSSEFVLQRFEAVRLASLSAPAAEPKQLPAPEIIEGESQVVEDDELTGLRNEYNAAARRAKNAGVSGVVGLKRADDLEIVQEKFWQLHHNVTAFAAELHATAEIPGLNLPEEYAMTLTWLDTIEEMLEIIKAGADVERELVEVTL